MLFEDVAFARARLAPARPGPPWPACIPSNREPRYCTVSRCFPTRPVYADFVALADPPLRHSDPLPRRIDPRTIFTGSVAISINKEIPIQGRTLAYPMLR